MAIRGGRGFRAGRGQCTRPVKGRRTFINKLGVKRTSGGGSVRGPLGAPTHGDDDSGEGALDPESRCRRTGVDSRMVVGVLIKSGFGVYLGDAKTILSK